MKMRLRQLVVIAVAAAVAAACRTAAPQSSQPTIEPAAPPIIQPGAPGQSGRVLAPNQATDLSRVQFTDADVRFMQGMIAHHAQALEMTDLLRTRTESDDMRKLALRMEVSQADEITMMQQWLQARAQEVPGPHAHHTGMLMPGMLTAEEMARLAEAKGPAFDRLFLEGMIKHHGGALTMVQELFETPGAAQDSEIFAFASDVEADQQMEIDRMGAMLSALLKERGR